MSKPQYNRSSLVFRLICCDCGHELKAHLGMPADVSPKRDGNNIWAGNTELMLAAEPCQHCIKEKTQGAEMLVRALNKLDDQRKEKAK